MFRYEVVRGRRSLRCRCSASGHEACTPRLRGDIVSLARLSLARLIECEHGAAIIIAKQHTRPSVWAQWGDPAEEPTDTRDSRGKILYA